MSNKTRNILKALAVILVLLTVLIHLNFIGIAGITASRNFWIAIIGFGLLLIGSK